MKQYVLFGAVIALVVVMSSLAFGQTIQASAIQTVTLGVNSIYRLAVTGSPNLLITNGSAGVDTLVSAVDATTARYSMTANEPVAHLTVQLSAALGAGVDLTLSVPSNRGTTAGPISVASGNPVNVVNTLSRGSDNNQPITYILSARADAAPFTSTPFVLTWTLQD
jgi:hypothetical protein